MTLKLERGALTHELELREAFFSFEKSGSVSGELSKKDHCPILTGREAVEQIPDEVLNGEKKAIFRQEHPISPTVGYLALMLLRHPRDLRRELRIASSEIETLGKWIRRNISPSLIERFLAF